MLEKIKTPMGDIIVVSAADPEHPGVFISLERASDKVWFDLVGVEYTDKNEEGGESINAFVWSDVHTEEWQEQFVFSSKEINELEA